MFMEKLVSQFLPAQRVPSGDTCRQAYERAKEFALKELGGTELQAACFASWFTTLLGVSEPHPLPHPVRLPGLDRAFVRTAWGEKPWLPRLYAFGKVEGNYEAAFRRVWNLIKRILPSE